MIHPIQELSGQTLRSFQLHLATRHMRQVLSSITRPNVSKYLTTDTQWRNLLQLERSQGDHREVAPPLQHAKASLSSRIPSASAGHYRTATRTRRDHKHSIVSHSTWCKMSGRPIAEGGQPLRIGLERFLQSVVAFVMLKISEAFGFDTAQRRIESDASSMGKVVKKLNRSLFVVYSYFR